MWASLDPAAQRIVRRALTGVGAYLLLAVLFLGGSALFARSGLDELRSLRAEAGPQDLLDGSAADRIDGARTSFDRASILADNVVLAPLRVLPIVGRHVEAVGAMATAAEELTAVAADGVGEAAELTESGLPTGAERVDVLQSLVTITERAAARLAVVDLGPSALIGPVGSARQQFGDEKQALEELLLDTRDAAQGLADVFEGPSAYLLLAANNAEMRAGSGMALSAGLMRFRDGEIELDDMQSTADLQVPGGVDDYDADFAALWGFANPDEEWRNLLFSPRYPASARLGRDMWAALGRPPIDGVLTVDIAALRSLLGALGPVQVSGRQIDEDNVVRLLQHDQYIGVENDEQAARRDALGDVADAVVDRLDTSSPDLGELVGGLRSAAAGRHILLWSNERGLQRAWESIGVGGEPAPNDLLVGVLNEGGNKLDQFLDVRARLEPGPGRSGRLVLRVTNTVPAGEPAYIAGVAPEAVGGYGVYPGYLAVSFPGGTEATVAEGPPVTLSGPDGSSQTYAALTRIAPGEDLRWVLDFTLADGVDEVRVAPSARLPAVRWTVRGEQWRDDRRPSRVIDW